ncbi:MAG: hypothetical protein ABIB98_00535 [bacterium]
MTNADKIWITCSNELDGNFGSLVGWAIGILTPYVLLGILFKEKET